LNYAVFLNDSLNKKEDAIAFGKKYLEETEGLKEGLS
jgi:hypothetical protein